MTPPPLAGRLAELAVGVGANVQPGQIVTVTADLGMEEVVRERIAGGDERIALVEGRDLVGADDLPDGVHPGDHGHAVLAAAFGDAIAAALANTRQ